MKGRPLRERLGFAAAGIAEGWRREQSFRVHVGIAATALVVLLATRPSPVWWAMFGIVAALVTAFELVNSALEALVDLLHPGLHPEVKAIKDMLSGAVMLAGVAALLVAAAFVAAHAQGWLAWWQGSGR
ncbi:diacylglycerol kinase [Sphingomonas bacterium]|uniref:diacylglycerol kinase n=1 Tax=Sphingomonas bacterium TaxID=1895847 RepID=UPI0015774607|nr:diacylglycerol kinase [Sphingomonas bacterium]